MSGNGISDDTAEAGLYGYAGLADPSDLQQCVEELCDLVAKLANRVAKLEQSHVVVLKLVMNQMSNQQVLDLIARAEEAIEPSFADVALTTAGPTPDEVRRADAQVETILHPDLVDIDKHSKYPKKSPFSL